MELLRMIKSKGKAVNAPWSLYENYHLLEGLL